MKDRIIVIDHANDGVLCECETVSIAQNLSLGFINSSIRILPSSLPWLSQEYTQNFNDVNKHYQFRWMKIYDMKEDLITDEWINLRKLALIRNNAHRSWEVRCKQNLLFRNHEYFAEGNFDGFLWRELDKCVPEKDFYTQSIIEWAAISEISPATAYQELKLKAESSALLHIRNHAVHQKFSLLINKEYSREGMTKVVTAGVDYLIGQGQI